MSFRRKLGKYESHILIEVVITMLFLIVTHKCYKEGSKSKYVVNDITKLNKE